MGGGTPRAAGECADPHDQDRPFQAIPAPVPRAGRDYVVLFMESIRCGACRRKLAEVEGLGEIRIKCPRCKTMNVNTRAVSAPSPSAAERPEEAEHDQ